MKSSVAHACVVLEVQIPNLVTDFCIARHSASPSRASTSFDIERDRVQAKINITLH